MLILGDNIMHLPNMSQSLERAFVAERALVGYEVDDPSKYGVVLEMIRPAIIVK